VVVFGVSLPSDPAVFESHNVRQIHFHRGPAVGPAGGEPHPHEHPVTSRPQCERLYAQVGMGVKPALVLLPLSRRCRDRSRGRGLPER
jgi:hypothetical protein